MPMVIKGKSHNLTATYLQKVSRVVVKSAVKQTGILFRDCFSVESRFDIHLTFLI